MVFRRLQVSTLVFDNLVFSFTVLFYKKKLLSEKMSFAAFRTKIIAKQENARDRRQLPVSEYNIPPVTIALEVLLRASIMLMLAASTLHEFLRF